MTMMSRNEVLLAVLSLHFPITLLLKLPADSQFFHFWQFTPSLWLTLTLNFKQPVKKLSRLHDTFILLLLGKENLTWYHSARIVEIYSFLNYRNEEFLPLSHNTLNKLHLSSHLK